MTAEIGSEHTAHFTSLRRAELLQILNSTQADTDLRGDLNELAGDSTADLHPIQ